MKGERIGQLPGRLRGAHGTGGGLWVHATPCREPALRKRGSGVPWRPLPSLANRSCPSRKNGRPGLDDGQSDVRGRIGRSGLRARGDDALAGRLRLPLPQSGCGRPGGRWLRLGGLGGGPGQDWPRRAPAPCIRYSRSWHSPPIRDRRTSEEEGTRLPSPGRQQKTPDASGVCLEAWVGIEPAYADLQSEIEFSICKA